MVDEHPAYSERQRALVREVIRAALTVIAAVRAYYGLPSPRDEPRTNMEARMQSKAAMLDYAEERNKTPS